MHPASNEIRYSAGRLCVLRREVRRSAVHTTRWAEQTAAKLRRASSLRRELPCEEGERVQQLRQHDNKAVVRSMPACKCEFITIDVLQMKAV